MKASKIVDTLSRLVGIARGGKATVETVEAALVEARERVSAAVRDHDAAQAAYEAGLLEQPPEALARLVERKAAAAIERDRSEALVKALEDRLAQARADDERAARKAVHDDAVQKADAIKARFAAEYAHHAGAIRGLLADLAAAEVAAENANKFDAEFGYVPRVEDMIRGGVAKPEEIIDTETVELWCIDGRVEPVPAEQQADVRPAGANHPGRGYLPFGAGSTNGGQWDCTLRSYRKVTYREVVPGSDAVSLLRAVNLPACHHLAEGIVTAERWRGVDTALGHLTTPRAPDPVVTRATRERLELIAEDVEPARETIVAYPKREPVPPRTPSAREIRRDHTPSRIMASERRAG